MPARIYPDVERNLQELNEEERCILNPFLDAGFSISFMTAYTRYKISHWCFFLEPNAALQESYGFERDIVLFYIPGKIQPRSSFQTVEHYMRDPNEPARGYVETMFYFLCSKGNDLVDHAKNYNLRNSKDLISVPLPFNDLIRDGASSWTIRNAIHTHVYTLDKYSEKLPLKDDSSFFGRQHEQRQLMQVFARGENYGVFGLRKTGKTSLLLRLIRSMNDDNSYIIVFIDAENPDLRRMRWHNLLQDIAQKIFDQAGILDRVGDFEEATTAQQFEQALSDAIRLRKNTSTRRIVIVIDEVEWLSPRTCDDKHWDKDFISFWHTIRTIQNKRQTLSVVIAGVNPSMVEEANFNGLQNPLFGIVKPIYLSGLKREECDEMILEIGRSVGLRVTSDGLDYIYDEYGGHPMLTRLACSSVVDVAKWNNLTFPITVDKKQLLEGADLRDQDLLHYSAHIVKELEDYYPDEYSLLESLAVNDYWSFLQASRSNVKTVHLFKYGIISNPQSPFITYKVVGEYVAQENARREGRVTKRRVVKKDVRSTFVNIRMKNVIEDMRSLESMIRRDITLPQLFGANSFPEADRLMSIETPHDANTLSASLTPLDRSFIESIKNYGLSMVPPSKKYFYNEIKTRYPGLQDALQRIHLYRDSAQHLILYPNVARNVSYYRDKDLDNEMVEGDEKAWFFFQVCLDELFAAIQREISKLQR